VSVIALPGTMDSRVLAGMVWDMYKAADPVPNSVNVVRATQATGKGKPAPMMALYLYPTAVEGDAVRDFYIARGEGGSGIATKRKIVDRGIEKRSLFDIIYGAINISIIYSIF